MKAPNEVKAMSQNVESIGNEFKKCNDAISYKYYHYSIENEVTPSEKNVHLLATLIEENTSNGNMSKEEPCVIVIEEDTSNRNMSKEEPCVKIKTKSKFLFFFSK